MVVHKAHETAKEWDAARPGTRAIALDLQDAGATDEPDGIISEVVRMVAGFSKHNTASPLENMLALRGYGMDITYSKTAEGRVSWKDNNTLLFENIQFTIGQFRGTIHGLGAQASDILADLLYKDLPAVP
jgi:hypothetical protein